MISFIARYYRRFLVSVEVMSDLLAILSAFLLGVSIYGSKHHHLIHSPPFTILALTTAIVGVLIFERMGLYRQQVSLMNLIEIRKIVRATFLLCLGLMFYSYFQKIYIPRTLLGCIVAMILIFVLTERMLFFKLQQALYIRRFNVRRVLILGAGESGRLLYQNISQAPKFGYFAVGFLDLDQTRLEQTSKWFAESNNHTLRFFNDISKLPEIIETEQVNEIFISNPLHDMGQYDIQKLASLCNSLDIKLNFVPFIVRGYCTNQLQTNDINGIPLISLRPFPVSHAEQISKRIFDLTIVSILLLLSSPIFLVIAMLIRSDSKGPVIFKQKRVGKDGVHFPIYKFRTMHADSPQYANSPKTSNDPRITKSGHFLRKTSLDELPQLINVLKGEMSLVGPRPEMPFIVENEYNDLCRQRLRVKPGITGIWQISGDRTREIHENISYDIFYIENRSLLLDTIILIRTLIFGIMAMRTH